MISFEFKLSKMTRKPIIFLYSKHNSKVHLYYVISFVIWLAYVDHDKNHGKNYLLQKIKIYNNYKLEAIPRSHKPKIDYKNYHSHTNTCIFEC